MSRMEELGRRVGVLAKEMDISTVNGAMTWAVAVVMPPILLSWRHPAGRDGCGCRQGHPLKQSGGL